MIKQKFVNLALTAILSTSLIIPTTATAASAPLLHNENATANFGDWYTGALPANAANNRKPVILFVQGLHSNYNTWLGNDSYYDAAYNAGYRTAFVQLRDSDGNGGDMYTNGKVLADVIRKVATYYNVPKINIIAHSKGGIDTQTALVHYGASSYVNIVHQLSTPNKGSELADIAYSSWASWLAGILGQKDDAVYSLQTSYMANFRALTDARSENSLTKTYMSGGKGDDGLFTSYWFAHAVLPGEDDGAVSIDSALGLPYGIASFTKNISHSAMTKASQTWSLVQPKLTLGYSAVTSDSTHTLKNVRAYPKNDETLSAFENEKNKSFSSDGDLILRGGEVFGTESVSIPLESGINNVAFEAMTSKSDTEILCISPSGRTFSPKPTQMSSDPYGIFSNAVRRVFQISYPEAGEWKIIVNSKEDAYFIMTRIDTPNKTTIKSDRKVFRKGQSFDFSLNMGGKFKGKVKHSHLSKSMNNFKQSNDVPQGIEESSFDDNLNVSYKAPNVPGVYNLSFDVEGVNPKGEKYVRSINYNFSVTDDQGNIK